MLRCQHYNLARRHGHARSTFSALVAAIGVVFMSHVGLVAAEQAELRPQQSQSTSATSGSGFLVAPGAYILTNAHVVEGCTTVQVLMFGSRANATVTATDEENDLALVFLPPPVPDTLSAVPPPLRVDVGVGEPIEVYGFPLPGILTRTGNFTTGNVSALAGPKDDARYLQMSAPIQGGNSGGPVLDQSGNVVGVVVAKLRATEVDVPQNVNFAIKADTVLKFLRANAIRANTSISVEPLDNGKIAARARLFTLQVVCIAGASVAQQQPLPQQQVPPIPPQSLPQPVSPPELVQKPSPEIARGAVTRALTDLHLRSQPNKDAPDVLGPPPDDYIPRGAIVQLIGGNIDQRFGCVRVAISEPGLSSVWCPVKYSGIPGWANAYYLDRGTGVAWLASSIRGCTAVTRRSVEEVVAECHSPVLVWQDLRRLHHGWHRFYWNARRVRLPT